MKQIHFIAFLLAIVLVGCEQPHPSKTVTYPYQEFATLICNVPIRVTFSAKATEVVLTAENQLLDDFVIDYSAKDTLLISIDNLITHTWEEQPWVILPIPNNLSLIKTYGMLTLETDSTLVTDSLTLDFAAAVQMTNWRIETKQLNIKSMSYGTNIQLSGIADTVSLDMHSSHLDASALSVDTYDCTLWSSQADIWCAKALNILLANGSTINYSGSCEVYQQIENIWNSTITKINK